MKHRLTSIILVSAFLIIGGIFVKSTFVQTLERTVATIPMQPSVQPTAPNLRVAPPSFQPDARQDSPRRDSNHSPQPQTPD